MRRLISILGLVVLASGLSCAMTLAAMRAELAQAQRPAMPRIAAPALPPQPVAQTGVQR